MYTQEWAMSILCLIQFWLEDSAYGIVSFLFMSFSVNYRNMVSFYEVHKLSFSWFVGLIIRCDGGHAG